MVSPVPVTMTSSSGPMLLFSTKYIRLSPVLARLLNTLLLKVYPCLYVAVVSTVSPLPFLVLTSVSVASQVGNISISVSDNVPSNANISSSVSAYRLMSFIVSFVSNPIGTTGELKPASIHFPELFK